MLRWIRASVCSTESCTRAAISARSWVRIRSRRSPARSLAIRISHGPATTAVPATTAAPASTALRVCDSEPRESRKPESPATSSSRADRQAQQRLRRRRPLPARALTPPTATAASRRPDARSALRPAAATKTGQRSPVRCPARWPSPAGPRRAEQAVPEELAEAARRATPTGSRSGTSAQNAAYISSPAPPATVSRTNAPRMTLTDTRRCSASPVATPATRRPSSPR